jgi:hypothetical protein
VGVIWTAAFFAALDGSNQKGEERRTPKPGQGSGSGGGGQVSGGRAAILANEHMFRVNKMNTMNRIHFLACFQGFLAIGGL